MVANAGDAYSARGFVVERDGVVVDCLAGDNVCQCRDAPEHFGLVYAHMIGVTIMLFIGAINLYIGTTSRYFKYHKLFGRTYLIGGTIGVAF